MLKGAIELPGAISYQSVQIAELTQTAVSVQIAQSIVINLPLPAENASLKMHMERVGNKTKR